MLPWLQRYRPDYQQIDRLGVSHHENRVGIFKATDTEMIAIAHVALKLIRDHHANN